SRCQAQRLIARMRLTASFALAAGIAVLAPLLGCGPDRYYIANVYKSGDQLLIEKCAIPRQNGKPDPTDCHLEPVGPPPAGAKVTPARRARAPAPPRRPPAPPRRAPAPAASAAPPAAAPPPSAAAPAASATAPASPPR